MVERAVPTGEVVRNLVYFVCPLSENDVWKWNVEQLKKRLHLFNGRKLIGVAQGFQRRPGNPKRSAAYALDPIEKVIEQLPGCDFMEFKNDAAIGEVVGWTPMMERILPARGVTFYGHAKGVRRGFGHPTAIRWTEAMYETLLDYWPLVEKLLDKYPVVGSFKKVGFCFPNTLSAWHYSGSFAWFRNEDLAARDWRGIPRMWAGTEALPGVLFKPEEAGCMFHEATANEMELYNKELWDILISPALEVWKAAHALDLSPQPA